jgi:hypothetical protein
MVARAFVLCRRDARREPRLRQHPPQVDDHLQVDVLAARRVQDLGLRVERDFDRSANGGAVA